MNHIKFDNRTIKCLTELSNEINELYGFVALKGSNFGEPAINSGPCGPFADLFFESWNKLFDEKVQIVFVFDKKTEECWHILIRLPNGMFYDGGHGIHDESKYAKESFRIEDMKVYDRVILEKNAYGLERQYPRFCPTFSKEKVHEIINKHLLRI